MELSELTNKELKYILRQNNVKNYSKLNKKDLVKKVNQLIKAQNGGNNKKKNKLNELIGGALNREQLLSENQREEINQRNINSSKSRGGYNPPKPPEIGPQPETQLSQPQSQPQTQLSQIQPQQQLPTPLPPAPGPPPPSPFPSAPPFNIRRNNSQNPVPPNSSQNPVQTNSSKNTVPPKPKSCDMCLIQ